MLRIGNIDFSEISALSIGTLVEAEDLRLQ
jgi:hypothetical protein